MFGIKSVSGMDIVEMKAIAEGKAASRKPTISCNKIVQDCFACTE